MTFLKSLICVTAMTALASARPSLSAKRDSDDTDKTLDFNFSSGCQGSTSNGECCPYGAFESSSKKCCPYGNIINDNCCVTGSTKSWGNVISTGGDRRCPDGSISVSFDASNYSSLVASATKKVGATASATSTGSSNESTATGAVVDESTSATTSTSSDSTSNSESATSASTSTSTGLAARPTGSISLAMILGAGAMLI